MTEPSTYDYLVRKMYNETEPSENQAIEEAFKVNKALKEKYDTLMASKVNLDNLQLKEYGLKQDTVEKILQFSKITSIAGHKN